MAEYGQYQKNAWTIDCVTQVIDFLRMQNRHRAGLMMPQVVESLQEFCTKLSESGEEQVQILLRLAGALQEFLQAQSLGDDLLCADLLEQRILPILYEYQSEGTPEVEEDIRAASEMTHGAYTLEPTMSGFYTIRKNGEHPIYLHGNGNPMGDARKWANSEYQPEKRRYVVWGIGLGYHVRALEEACGKSVEIEVFEQNSDLIEVARKYGVASDFEIVDVNGEFHPSEERITDDHAAEPSRNLRPRIRCIHDPYGKRFAASMRGENVGLLLHYPSIRAIEDERLRSVFFRLWVTDVSGKQNKMLLLQNFYHNAERMTKPADLLEEKISGKRVILIAAGPSLDAQMELLKSRFGEAVLGHPRFRRIRRFDHGDYFLLAVGTVYRKLLAEGIRPDAVVFMDAQERSVQQLENLTFELETAKQPKLLSPLVIDSTAHWRAAAEYDGEVYLACQEGFGPAESMANGRRMRLYQTGGSVTTLALDLAIQCDAREIITIGMDLAYTGGVSHASATADRHETQDELTVETKGWSGGTVQTSELFNMYRVWIERRIADTSGVRFINATEGGAYVSGMEHLRLAECLDD